MEASSSTTTPSDGKAPAVLDDNAKAEIAAVVEATVAAKIADLSSKFDTLSVQAGEWRTNMETAVSNEFQKFKGEVVAAGGGSAGGRAWSGPDRPVTVMSPECWIAYDYYPQLITTAAEAGFVLQAAVDFVVANGNGPDSAAVTAVKMAFEPVMLLCLDPVARNLSSSIPSSLPPFQGHGDLPRQLRER